MITFTMMVGIVGAGKSSYAEKLSARTGALHLSSDAMRLRLFGDESDQTHNSEVFQEMLHITNNALKAGMSVIYDACNLSSKRRISLLKGLRVAYPGVTFKCIVMNTPIAICYERISSRSRVVPTHVVARQLRQFMIPYYGEGWDEIEVINDETLNTEAIYEEEISRMETFGGQHNSHHNLSLIDHSEWCRRYYQTLSPYAPYEFYVAARFHDVGKIYTQTFDEQGEAHYKNHANYGAYIVLNITRSLDAAALVNYHMMPFDKTSCKVWENRLGEYLWNEILLLHEADLAAKL